MAQIARQMVHNGRDPAAASEARLVGHQEKLPHSFSSLINYGMGRSSAHPYL